jgi:hypothetical protein
MRPAGISRLRAVYGLTMVSLGAVIGVGWALQALGQTQSGVPSAASRRASLPTAPTTHSPGVKALPQGAAKPNEKTASVDFDDWTEDQHTGITKGYQCVYKEDDATIKGDHAIWNENKRTLDADGHLVFDDSTHHAIADRAHVNDITQTADFEGNITLLLKSSAPATTTGTDAGKSEDRDSLKSHGATVTCDKLRDQYAENKKLVTMYGHLVFKQSYKGPDGEPVERILTAEHGEYNGKTETMILYPPIAGHNNKGETFNQDKDIMTIGTKEGQETVTGRHGHIVFHPHHESTDSAPSSTGSGQGGAGSNPPQDTPPGSKTDTKDDDKKTSGDGGH